MQNFRCKFCFCLALYLIQDIPRCILLYVCFSLLFKDVYIYTYLGMGISRLYTVYKLFYGQSVTMLSFITLCCSESFNDFCGSVFKKYIYFTQTYLTYLRHSRFLNGIINHYVFSIYLPNNILRQYFYVFH